MNVPNYLTTSRFFLTFLFASFAQGQGLAMALWALAIFTLASVTDWADGYLARKWNQISAFGKIIDPVADKVLTLTAFFIFSFEGLFWLWLVMVIAAREILVTASRIYLLTKGEAIPAEQAGKIKTVVQMVTIFVALIYRVLADWPVAEGFITNSQNLWQIGLNFLMIVAAVLTLWSGWQYFSGLKEK